MHQALFTKNSILYREENFKGLGFSKQFINSISTDYEFVESRFNPLGGFEYIFDKATSPKIIKKYAELIKCIVESYFISKTDFWVKPNAIHTALKSITALVGKQVNKVDSLQNDEFINTDANEIIHEVSSLLENLTILVIECSNKISAKVKEVNDNISIYKEIAEGIFNFLEALSMTSMSDEKFYHASWSVWFTLYHWVDQSENSTKLIQKELEDLIFRRLELNLKNGGFYPIMRPLLTIFGLKAESTLFDKIFRKKFFDYVKDNFKSSAEKLRTFKELCQEKEGYVRIGNLDNSKYVKPILRYRSKK